MSVVETVTSKWEKKLRGEKQIEVFKLGKTKQIVDHGHFATVTLTGCGQQYIVLDPKGPVGEIQYNLIVTSAILMGIVVLPVLIFMMERSIV